MIEMPELTPGQISKKLQIAYLSPSFDISDGWERLWWALQHRLEELEVDYELTTLAVESHTAHDVQLSQVETVITKGVDYVVLGPTDFNASIPALKALKDAGIPVVYYNFTYQHDDPDARDAVIQYIGFSHGYGGRMIGAWIVDHLYKQRPKASDEIYKVAIIYGAPGRDSAERGGEAAKVLDLYPDIQVVFEHYADWDRIKAYEVTHDMLMLHPDVKVIYACASGMALGAASAVAEVGKSDQIAVIGFGCTAEELEAIKSGTMGASPLRLQDYGGVGMANAIYAHELGLEIPKVWSGPFVMVDTYEEGMKWFDMATSISKPKMGR
jgi:ABC-type sugar transport system substrate-binding protein